jgi:hypothetical protein
MKLVPFLISTVVSAIALVLAIVHFTSGNSNLHLQADLQKKNQEIQVLREDVEGKQRTLQGQQQIIEAGAAVAQKYGPPILRDMGLLAARNKNEKLKNLLVRQKLEAYIPNDEQLKQIEEQIKKAQQQQGGSPAPAPAAGNAPQ